MQYHTVTFSLALLFFGFYSAECRDCQEGWTYYGGNCYVLLHDIMSWYEASEACDALHGKLAEVANADENNFLTNLLKNQHVAFAWLGLEDLVVEGKFVWASEGAPPTFHNFYVGQPNDGARNEDCVSIHSSGGWFDDHCHASLHPALCQTAAYGIEEGELIG